MDIIYFSFDEVIFLVCFITIVGLLIRHFEIKHDKKKRDNFRNGYK